MMFFVFTLREILTWGIEGSYGNVGWGYAAESLTFLRQKRTFISPSLSRQDPTCYDS